MQRQSSLQNSYLTSLVLGMPQGTIPVELTQCWNLRSLDLATNRLGGTISPDLQFFPSLSKLKIDHNDLTGTLPPELSGLSTTLTWLDTSWNALGGNIPSDIALLTNLEWLYLERNVSSSELLTSHSSACADGWHLTDWMFL